MYVTHMPCKPNKYYWCGVVIVLFRDGMSSYNPFSFFLKDAQEYMNIMVLSTLECMAKKMFLCV